MEDEGLPEGVLSINEATLGTIEGWDRLDVAILMPMWRSMLFLWGTDLPKLTRLQSRGSCERCSGSRQRGTATGELHVADLVFGAHPAELEQRSNVSPCHGDSRGRKH